ncbi:MAG: multifunctional CCA tRNA nucleotidyl transferase/2'3'-cyclic phosphodiesterase/2'nucleotidase/phosphatase [Halopseudomonas sp.]
MQVYQVGGAVRDRLLGIPVYDRDWVVVGATVEQMLALGYQPVGKDFPVFLHPETHQEYALARTERKSGRGYGGFQCNAAADVTLEQDLQRRDLTINAMAENHQGELFDPYGGQQDITQRLLRHVSPAFAEDPLRVLRVARFLARFHRLGFTIHPATMALMTELSSGGELQELSAERVWRETERALTEANPEQYFITLARCGALQQLMPELAEVLAPLSENESALQPLLRACTISDQPPVRWAVVCHGLKTDEKLTELHQRLKIPKQFHDNALLLWRYQSRLADTLTAADVMALYQGLDLKRRPDRLDPFIMGCRAVAGLSAEQPFSSASTLQQLVKAISQINPQALIEQGFKGAELGNEIKRQQQLILEQALPL